MHKKIIERIRDIEKTEEVRVLFACESGSRAWGFPSPDSDYDVRMIYCRPREWYLSVYEGRDVLEYPIEDNFDVCGWDIKKTLGLVHKSNAVVWEWLQSPVIYYQEKNFSAQFLSTIKAFFSPKTALYHYLSSANKIWHEIRGQPQVKIKKIFYIVRPLMAARWIAEFEIMPPMDLSGLLRPEFVSDEEETMLANLVTRKSMAYEANLMEWDEKLRGFIESNLDICEAKKEGAPARKENVKPLDQFFRDLF